eukprot:750200-Amorphochlora_amoeboformis.AAC.1
MPVGQIWKSRCFYMDGKNRYFYERDFEKMPSSTPVPKSEISDVIVRCLTLMGWGDTATIQAILSEKKRSIMHKRIQSMYHLLKAKGGM